MQVPEFFNDSFVGTGRALFNSETELGQALREAFPGNVKSIQIHITPEEVTVKTETHLSENIVNANTWKLVMSFLKLIQENPS